MTALEFANSPIRTSSKWIYKKTFWQNAATFGVKNIQACGFEKLLLSEIPY